jgi:hypothetical protein
MKAEASEGKTNKVVERSSSRTVEASACTVRSNKLKDGRVRKSTEGCGQQTADCERKLAESRWLSGGEAKFRSEQPNLGQRS